MHRKILITILSVVVLVQLSFLFSPAAPDRYRLKERADAYRRWKSEPSSANEAALNEEYRLRDAHEDKVGALIIGGFLLFDAVIVSLIWNEGKQENVA